MTVIDVHAHSIPPAFREWLDSHGAGVGATPVARSDATAVDFLGKRTTAPMPGIATGLDRRLAEMDRTGVDQQVLAGWIDLTGYEIEAGPAVTYSVAHNDCLAEEAATAPDRFRPIGTVPLQAPEAAVDELQRCMGELGMVGVELATTIRGKALDQWDLDPFWEAAQELRAFILLHPMTPLLGVDLDRMFMSNLVGRPAESTITVAGLVLSGVLERFPDLTICSVHGGGFAPYQMGRLDRGAALRPDLVPELTKPPSEYVKQIYIDTVLHNAGAARYAIDAFGVDKVLLGTDYPFPMGELEPVDFVKSIPGLSDADVAAIVGGNAERLLS